MPTFRTHTRLTTDGIAGVWLFLGAPLLQAFAVWIWYVSGVGLWSTAFFAIGGFAFLAGCVLLLIGREQVGQISD